MSLPGDNPPPPEGNHSLMAMTRSVLARVKSKVKELWLLVYTQRPECFLEALRRLRVVSSQLIPRSNPPPFTQTHTNTAAVMRSLLGTPPGQHSVSIKLPPNPV